MINLLLFSGMSEKKLISKIEPFTQLKYIGTIFTIRNRPINYNRIKSISTPNVLSKVTLFRELYRFLSSLFLILLNRINVIYGIYLTMHGIYAFVLGKIFKKPIIQNIIGTDTRKIFKSRILQKIIIKSDIIIVRGNQAKKDFIEFGTNKNKIFIIPNFFIFHNRIIKTNKINFDLIYVGAYNSVKRLDILIASVYLLKNKLNIDIKVCLVGDGTLKNNINDLIIKNKLQNNFFLVGEQINVENYLLQSKAFIMTSEFEGLPQAMIEALACGLPVIMPNISNIPEYAIDGYNALLVKPLDVEGFAHAIYRMLTDDKLYKKLKSGAEKFREEHEYEFSMENITNIWNDIFKQLGLIEENNAK